MIQSIDEGRYGNGSYPGLSPLDFEAAELAADTDYVRARYRTGGHATHRAAHGAALRRFAHGRRQPRRPVGAANDVLPFDDATGALVAIPPALRLLPLPPSLRQDIKKLHRFWSRHDTPGVYVEFLSEIVLWVLIVTGLWMYCRLLAARSAAGERRLLWLLGGLWRSLHRVVVLTASVLLVAIAFSGTFLGCPAGRTN